MTAPDTLRTATIEAATLRDVLGHAGRVTERRNTIPVLCCLRLSVGRTGLTVEATDLDNHVTLTREADGPRRPIEALVTPRVLDHVRRLGTTLTVTDRGDGVLTAGGELGEARFRCFIPLDDWPQTHLPQDPVTFEVGEGALHRIVSTCRATASVEATRYYLEGIFLHDRDGHMTAVTTDGHRLTRLDCEGQPWPAPPVILPLKAADILQRQLRRDGNRTVRIACDAERCRITFDLDGYRQMSRLIDGTFPDYTRVIPSFDEAGISVVLTHDQVARLGPPSARNRTCVRIDPAAGMMSRLDEDLTIEVPIQRGQGEAIGLNLAYLAGMTRQSGTLRLSGRKPGDPLLVHDEDPSLTRVIMPMRLR